MPPGDRSRARGKARSTVGGVGRGLGLFELYRTSPVHCRTTGSRFGLGLGIALFDLDRKSSVLLDDRLKGSGQALFEKILDWNRISPVL